MSYSSRTIGDVIDDVNRTYFLPAIQRPYVWSSKQVIALFDSLLKGYPISTFMLWAVDEATKHEVRSYNFVNAWRPETRNELAVVDGRSVVLVLDGQQRLTSLLIGLRGTFAEKKKNARQSNPDAWGVKSLFLDLLKDGDDDNGDDELGVTYALAFHETRPRNDHRQHWFRLGAILDHPSDAQLDTLIAKVQDDLHRGVTAYDRELVERNLRLLHRVIWRDEVVNYYTENDQSLDRVLEIFVRANDGGTKLSKADLMMSLITSKWTNGRAREDVFGFVDHINRGLGQPNKVTRDFLLKACLVLCDFDVRYSVGNFTSQAITMIEDKWLDIKAAIENTFRLVNRWGLNEEHLSSLNALLPIAYYLCNTRGFTFRGSTEFERINSAAIHKWLMNSLLVGAFAGNSDQAIAIARGTVKEHLRSSRDFPTQKLFESMARGGRLSRIDDRAIEEILSYEYGRSRSFIALSLLYGEIDWVGSKWHVDHIIPQASAGKNVLRGMNLPEHRVLEITSAANRLGNLQLLPAGENIEKSATPFDSWITGRDRFFRDRHMIPDEADLWRVTMLPEFVREREKVIRQRLLNFS